MWQMIAYTESIKKRTVTVWGHGFVVQYRMNSCLALRGSTQSSDSELTLFCENFSAFTSRLKQIETSFVLFHKSAHGGSSTKQGQLHKGRSVQYVKAKISNSPCCSPQVVLKMFDEKVKECRVREQLLLQIRNHCSLWILWAHFIVL